MVLTSAGLVMKLCFVYEVLPFF